MDLPQMNSGFLENLGGISVKHLHLQALKRKAIHRKMKLRRFEIALLMHTRTWKTALWIGLLLVFGEKTTAQDAKTDSIARSFQQEKNDTLRFHKLCNYTDRYLEVNSIPKVARSLLPFLSENLRQAEKLDLPFWVARTHQSMACCYLVLFQNKEGFEHLYKARAYWDKTANARGLAGNMFLEGKMLIGNGGEKRSLELWDKALSLCRTHGMNDLRSTISGYAASYWLASNQYEKAIAMYKEWFKVPNQDPLLTAYYLANLGSAYMNLKDFEKASFYTDSAIALAHRMQFRDMEGSLIFNKACQAFDQGKLSESENLALQSLPLVQEYGGLGYLVESYGLLMDIYKAKREFEKALVYSELYFKTNDSLRKLERQSEYRDLDRKYQSSLKSQKIKEQEALLEAESREKRMFGFAGLGVLVVSLLGGTLFFVNRKRKESQLETEIAESEMKALRAQMNPHFMFNSLNAIQQMVMNQENDNAYQYLDAYARLTRQILENSEKKWITVREELRFLELYLQIESLRFGHTFRYQLEVSDEVMPNSDKLPAMVVQPVVENALKHGLLPKQGEKRLRIFFDRKDEGPLEVVVEDNGVGRAAAGAVPKETDHHSMSLGITENRLRLLDSGKGSRMETEDLKTADGEAAGTRVTLFVFQTV